MSEPLVSAIVTTYKRDIDVFERAIKSIAAQTYKNIEILIVDDNDDNSVYCPGLQNVCEKYNAIYIKQNGNQGACAARNLGIDNSNGEFIAFLDDDDEWCEEKTEKQMEVFRQSSSDVGLVFCCGYTVDERVGTTRDYYTKTIFKKEPEFKDILINDHVGSTSNPLIRKECFLQVGGFWEQQPARQDYEMWIRIASKFKIVGLEEKLFKHYIHKSEQITKNSFKSYNGYKKIYERYNDLFRKTPLAEINILKNLLKLHKCYNEKLHLKYLTRFVFVCLKIIFSKDIKYYINKLTKRIATRILHIGPKALDM